MTTGTVGNQARQQHIQVVNTWRKTVNYNDAGLADGVVGVTVPMGSFFTALFIEIVTAFNAGTTNVLTVGTNSSSFNDMAAAGDVDEATPGIYAPTRGLGRSLTSLGDTTVYYKYTQSGTAATTGQAEIVLTYEANTG